MPTTQPAGNSTGGNSRPRPAPLWALIVAGAIFIVALACSAEPPSTPAPAVDPAATTPAADAVGL